MPVLLHNKSNNSQIDVIIEFKIINLMGGENSLILLYY